MEKALFYKMTILFVRIQDHLTFRSPHSLSFGEQWEWAFTTSESLYLWFSSRVWWCGVLPSPLPGHDERRTLVFWVGRGASQQTHPDPAHHVPTEGPREVTGNAPRALVSLGGWKRFGKAGGGALQHSCKARAVGVADFRCVNLPERKKFTFPVRCWHWAFINTAGGEDLKVWTSRAPLTVCTACAGRPVRAPWVLSRRQDVSVIGRLASFCLNTKRMYFESVKTCALWVFFFFFFSSVLGYYHIIRIPEGSLWQC